jgi:hypothetical protein
MHLDVSPFPSSTSPAQPHFVSDIRQALLLAMGLLDIDLRILGFPFNH